MSSASSEEMPRQPSRGRTASPPSCPSLPPSLQQRHTLDGRVFYVNHTKRETQRSLPRHIPPCALQPPPPPPRECITCGLQLAGFLNWVTPPLRAKPAGRKAGPQPGPNQSTLIDFFKPTSATNTSNTEDQPPAKRAWQELPGTSSSCVNDSDSDSDEDCDMIWAKAGRGVWGLCHVFEDTLCLTCDLMEDSAVASNQTRRAPSPGCLFSFSA